MNKSTTCKFIVVTSLVVGLLACGKDPYSGASEFGSLSGGTGHGGQAGDGNLGAGGASPNPTPVVVSNLTFDVSPVRQLDLVFMIDNSPSMAPKQAKLQAQFPKLIAALKNPQTGSLPDLHIAIIDSDLGTGGAYPDGSNACAPDSSKGRGAYGDAGKFQMPGAQNCGVTDPNATFLSYTSGKPDNFTGDINQVFTCLASGLGTNGCGEEHQLQAFEFALVAKQIGNDQQQADFLRPLAYLGLVFLTDEDDCSAATDDGMFGTSPGGSDLSKESPSLRCSTRAHQCGGHNMSDIPPGYPTTASFTADFGTCAARTDACPNPTDGTGSTDTSKPTVCSPLKDFKHIADEIKSLKQSPDQQILVAGIFGWPRQNDQPLPYKIDLAINPSIKDTTSPNYHWFDYWPVCYDPNHYSAADLTTYNPDDVGWGATGGLRESAFIDQFGQNDLKFSICESDFTDAMAGIGTAMANKLQDLCLNVKLVDTDLSAPGLQLDCRVVYRYPPASTNFPWTEDPTPLAQCDPSYSNANPPPDSFGDCWEILNDTTKCPNAPYGQSLRIVRTASHVADGPLAVGTEVAIQCQTCPTSAVSANSECNY